MTIPINKRWQAPKIAFEANYKDEDIEGRTFQDGFEEGFHYGYLHAKTNYAFSTLAVEFWRMVHNTDSYPSDEEIARLTQEIKEYMTFGYKENK